MVTRLAPRLGLRSGRAPARVSTSSRASGPRSPLRPIPASRHRWSAWRRSRTARPKAGGGTANTAFLATSGNHPGGNAQATLAEATFWIETIAGTGGQPDKHQLQYTQLVMLDFNNIHWPHVTVGTLVKQ
jgi:hypothetical protein